MNPDAQCTGLKLNISQVDNALDLALASTFMVKAKNATVFVRRNKAVIAQGEALELGVGLREQSAA